MSKVHLSIKTTFGRPKGGCIRQVSLYIVLRFCNDCIKKNCGTILIEALLDQTSLKLPVCLLLHTKSSHILLLC